MLPFQRNRDEGWEVQQSLAQQQKQRQNLTQQEKQVQ
jgi:hypothetical protein